jgi:glyoxylase-like metal-dependent hydrolase (beta-lactamase superfamily II)
MASFGNPILLVNLRVERWDPFVGRQFLALIFMLYFYVWKKRRERLRPLSYLYESTMLEVTYFTFSPFAENTYLLTDSNTRKTVVIDAGCYQPQEEAELKAHIESRGLEIVALWHTHCHLDHVFGAEFVRKTWRVEAYAHPLEAKQMEAFPTAAQMYGIPNIKPSRIDKLLPESGELHLGNSRVEILYVPGHSPGHLAFYAPKEGFCISGDVLFRGSVGRTDLPFGNASTLMLSIHNKIFKLPDETVIYSGHGQPTTVGHEKRTNPFCRIV